MVKPTDDLNDGYSSGDESGYRSGRASPELPELMTMQKSDNGVAATLSINLQPYVDSYKARDEALYQLHGDSLSQRVFGLSGEMIWLDMLKCAMDGAISRGNLSLNECRAIENSPVCTFMKDSFVEIVKNVMDEAILGCYESGKRAQLELSLSVDVSIPERIGLTISDNGRGFPPSFLEKNATAAGREAYIMEVGSNKPRAEKKLPALFGGAGLGLRILLAQVMHGDKLVSAGYRKPQYEKPEIAEIVLKNRDSGSGAQIEIVTSRAPLREKEVDGPGIDDAPVQLAEFSIRTPVMGFK